MKTRIIKSTRNLIIILFTLFFSKSIEAATVTSVTSGNWGSPTTWSITSRSTNGSITAATNSKTVTGGILTNFKTTLRAGNQILNTSNAVIGTVASIESNTSLTLVANASSAMNNAGWNSRGVVSIDGVVIASSHTITMNTTDTCVSLTFAAASSNTTMNFNDNTRLTVTGTVIMQNPNTNFVTTLNINNGALTCNALTTSGTLATRRTNINIINGSLDINGTYSSSNVAGTTINISGTGSINFGGNVSSSFTFIPGTSSTVIYDGSSIQTCKQATYNNLTLSGSGVKTTTSCTVNNILKIEGSATLSTAVSYGTAAGLVYNTAISRTASSSEWPTTFSGTQGVEIKNTGVITLNTAKIMGVSATLKINESSSLSTNNYSLTFNGNFINNGTLNAGTSNIFILGTQATQEIGKINTSGNIECSKTSGLATFTGNIICKKLSSNATLSVLSFGSATNVHEVDTINLSRGTIYGGSSTTTVRKSIISTNGFFVPESSTLIFNGSSQTNDWGEYYNLILQGGPYTFPALTITGDFTIRGSTVFTNSADVSVTGNLNIQENGQFNCAGYNTTVNGNLTVGDNSGGSVFINFTDNTGEKAFNKDVILYENSTFTNSSNEDITIGGNFVNSGYIEVGDGKYYFTGVDKNINSIQSLTFNNIEINGNITNTASFAVKNILSGTGTLINAGILYFTGLSNHSIATLNANSQSNYIYYTGNGDQNIINTNYYNLELSGSGNKILSSITTINGNFTITGNAIFGLNFLLAIIGDLYISGNATFSLTSNIILTISGNIENSSTNSVSFNGGLVQLNGSADQSITNYSQTNNFSNLVLSGESIKTFNFGNSINNTLHIDANTGLQIGNNSTLYLNCSITGTGKILGSNSSTNNSTNIEFSRSNSTIGNVYIDNTNKYFNNISVKNNCTVTLDDFGIYNSLILTSGKLIVSNKIDISSTNSTPISKTSGYLEMGSTSTLSFGEINSNSVAFTLPNSLFEYTPTFKNINFNRNTNLSLGNNDINLSGTLTITQGNLESNDRLTLKSNANGTARVATISNTNYGVIGNVNVERFIPGGPGKRKWRFLSFATSDNSLMSLNQLIDDILITAPAGAAGGFDINPLNPANTASLRTYTESTIGAASNGWTDPSSINNNIATGVGFEVFVRGSRTLTNPYLNWTEPDNVTIDYTGVLNKGDITKTLSYTNTNNSTSDGFNLVGNPYASAIDFENGNLTKTNIQNKFWSYNPNTGLYGIYDATLHTGTNSITQYIASSQGFFVKATAANPSITFKETCKSDNPGNNYFKSNNSSQNILPILKIGISNDSTFTDETLLVFDENASALGEDEHDAYKWFNDALNIYTISSDQINLNIDARNTPRAIDTIKLAVYSYNGSEIMSTHHQINFSGLESLAASTDVVLWDKYLNTFTNCKVYSQYDFMITTDNASYGKNRFVLLIGDVNIGLSSNQNLTNIVLYPNPAKNIIHLNTSNSLENKGISYSIFDQSGRMVLQGKNAITYLQSSINISSLQLGMYWVEIYIEDKVVRKKFIKQ